MLQRLLARLKLHVLKPIPSDHPVTLEGGEPAPSPAPDIASRCLVTRSPVAEWLASMCAVLLYLKLMMGSAFLASTSYIGEDRDPKLYQWFIKNRDAETPAFQAWGGSAT